MLSKYMLFNFALTIWESRFGVRLAHSINVREKAMMNGHLYLLELHRPQQELRSQLPVLHPHMRRCQVR